MKKTQPKEKQAEKQAKALTVSGVAYALLDRVHMQVEAATKELDAVQRRVKAKIPAETADEVLAPLAKSLDGARDALGRLKAVCHRIGDDYAAATTLVPREWLDDAVDALNRTEANIAKAIKEGIARIARGEGRWGDGSVERWSENAPTEPEG